MDLSRRKILAFSMASLTALAAACGKESEAETKSGPGCAECPARAAYDRDPKSIKGRLWRWHIGFCPGWKGYMESLPPEEKKKIEVKYGLKG